VLTGIGTVLEDNPRLDVRGHDVPRQPHLVIVDSRLETPLDARLFETLGTADLARKIWIYTAATGLDGKRQALETKGATVIDMAGPQGKVDLAAMLVDLARREINELHLEAGHKLNGSFIREGLMDELLLYVAPQLLGPGQGMAKLPALTDLSGSVKLAFHAVDRIGPDLRLLMRRQ
jgi:diaminohydroxyphosphoribosylaminopyrimidine deaminase/5-amino-6-(5-phosphoribosylamino)uracil reductase